MTEGKIRIEPHQFIDCLAEIRVLLDWSRMAAERWPASYVTIDSATELLELFIPHYEGSDGKAARYDAAGAFPITIDAALKKLGDPTLLNVNQDNIDKFVAIFKACGAPIEFAIPTYKLPNEKMLLLDGVHRTLALAHSGVPFRLNVVRLDGPLDKGALPDLIHW